MQQQYIGEAGKSTTAALQINLVYILCTKNNSNWSKTAETTVERKSVAAFLWPTVYQLHTLNTAITIVVTHFFQHFKIYIIIYNNSSRKNVRIKLATQSHNLISRGNKINGYSREAHGVPSQLQNWNSPTTSGIIPNPLGSDHVYTSDRQISNHIWHANLSRKRFKLFSQISNPHFSSNLKYLKVDLESFTKT